MSPGFMALGFMVPDFMGRRLHMSAVRSVRALNDSMSDSTRVDNALGGWLAFPLRGFKESAGLR